MNKHFRLAVVWLTALGMAALIAKAGVATIQNRYRGPMHWNPLPEIANRVDIHQWNMESLLPGFSRFHMEPNYGYWIKTSLRCTWTLP